MDHLFPNPQQQTTDRPTQQTNQQKQAGTTPTPAKNYGKQKGSYMDVRQLNEGDESSHQLVGFDEEA